MMILWSLVISIPVGTRVVVFHNSCSWCEGRTSWNVKCISRKWSKWSKWQSMPLEIKPHLILYVRPLSPLPYSPLTVTRFPNLRRHLPPWANCSPSSPEIFLSEWKFNWAHFSSPDPVQSKYVSCLIHMPAAPGHFPDAHYAHAQ